jgi:hypothetical protein
LVGIERGEEDEGEAAALIGLPPIFNVAAAFGGVKAGLSARGGVEEGLGRGRGEEGVSPVTLAMSSEGARATPSIVSDKAALTPSTLSTTELLMA